MPNSQGIGGNQLTAHYKFVWNADASLLLPTAVRWGVKALRAKEECRAYSQLP
jgi:hypothetical protein